MAVEITRLNRRETTWERESSYRRRTLYDALRLDRARSPCAKNMVHRPDRPIEFLNEGDDVCESVVATVRVAHLGVWVHAHLQPTWPCGTQLGYRLLSEPASPHSLARLPGNSVFRHEPPPRHCPVGGEGFEAAWPKLDFRPWNFGPMRANGAHTQEE